MVSVGVNLSKTLGSIFPNVALVLQLELGDRIEGGTNNRSKKEAEP